MSLAGAPPVPRSSGIDYRGSVRTTDDAESAPSRAIEDIAGAWLAAEQQLAGGLTGNADQAEISARALSDEYDQAIRGASREELRLAWEAARILQADTEMGSEAWAGARRLSELLRGEYLATAPDAAATDPPA